LQSIVDYERCPGCVGDTAAIDPIFGPIAANLYWSSTTFAFSPSGAYLVDFRFGLVKVADESAVFDVRAVRGGPK
jgi:hypothetical protein